MPGQDSPHLTSAHPGHILQEGEAEGRKVPGGGVGQSFMPGHALRAGPGPQRGQAEQGDPANPQPAPAPLACRRPFLSLAVRGRSGHWAFWRMQPGKDSDDDCPRKS